MTLLFKIGFLDVRLLDFLDVLLVAVLMYQLYRLVRGSLAFNILIGLLLVFIASLIVRALDMSLLSVILGQFIGVGVIAVLIVFQPEVRRFLLYLGRGSRLGGESFWKRLALRRWQVSPEQRLMVQHIVRAAERMGARKDGALIVCAVTSRLQHVVSTGVSMNAEVSSELLESLFYKNNPLHDGAVIIANGRVLAARCVLPVSDRSNLPLHLGLRHRAALGMSEQSDAVAIIVSEQNGSISYAHEGKLFTAVSIAELRKALNILLLESADLETEPDVAIPTP